MFQNIVNEFFVSDAEIHSLQFRPHFNFRKTIVLCADLNSHRIFLFYSKKNLKTLTKIYKISNSSTKRRFV